MGAILKDLEAKNANLAKLLQDVLDEELGPIRTDTREFANLSGETKAKWEKLQTDIAETNAEIKALKILVSTPKISGFDSPEVKEEHKQASKRAFDKALRLGWGRLDEEERKYVKLESESGIRLEAKTLYASDATTGGFLATPEFVNDLIKAIVLVSPMMDLVDVRMTSNPYIMIPKRTQTSTASRIAEQATRVETQNPKFGMVQVFPYESYALTLVSRTDLDDAEIDLAQFINDDQSVQFAKLAGSELINGLGSGSNQCLGILKDTNITGASNLVTTANSLAIAVGDITKLLHSIKTGYRMGSNWIGTTETLGYLRGLTDTTGRPLLQPFGSSANPDSLYGYPYIEMPDMPQIAANAYAMGFGNWKTAYQAVVRKQMTIVTLNERYADLNAVGFMGYYRFGGQTKLSEAVNLLKIHS